MSSSLAFFFPSRLVVTMASSCLLLRLQTLFAFPVLPLTFSSLRIQQVVAQPLLLGRMQTPVTRFPYAPRRSALAANTQVLQCILYLHLLLLLLLCYQQSSTPPSAVFSSLCTNSCPVPSASRHVHTCISTATPICVLVVCSPTLLPLLLLQRGYLRLTCQVPPQLSAPP